MLNEVFGDSFAHKDNFLTNIDARIKMIFVFGAIIAVLFSNAPYMPVTSAVLSLIFLLGIGIPVRIIIFRLLAPLTITILILFIQILFYGALGFTRGLLIMGKVMGCASLILFLSMTTPVNVLLQAASWFRAPKTWLEVASITYRYVFVLMEDAVTIRDAQKVRLGYSSLSRSLKSFAELAGSVLIRAYDQSFSTHEAMQLRGYSGSIKVSFEKRFEYRDGLHLIIFSAILFLLVILSLYWR